MLSNVKLHNVNYILDILKQEISNEKFKQRMLINEPALINTVQRTILVDGKELSTCFFATKCYLTCV